MKHDRIVILVLFILGLSRQSHFAEPILLSSSSSSGTSSSDDISELQPVILAPNLSLSPHPSSAHLTKLLIFQFETDYDEVKSNLEPFVTCTVKDDHYFSKHLLRQLSTVLSGLSSATAKRDSFLCEGINEMVELGWSLWDYAKDGAKLMRLFDEHICKLDEYKVKLDNIIRSFEGIFDKSYQERVERKIEEVKGTISTADLALQTLTSAKRSYGILLGQVTGTCMSALNDLLNDYEMAVNRLATEAMKGLASLGETPALGKEFDVVSSIVDSYSDCHSGYDRVRSVFDALASAIEGASLKGAPLHPMLHDLTSTLNSRLDSVMQQTPSTASLEAQICKTLAKESVAATAMPVDQQMSVFDVYSLDFDYEQYRLEFWHHSNLDDVNFVGDADPVFKQYFTKTLSRHGSTLHSPDYSGDREDEGGDDEDFDSIGKILRDFKKMSLEEFYDSSSSDEEIPPVQQITFHLLMGKAINIPDCLLVNPDGCPHSQERQLSGMTLISPPIDIKSCMFLTDLSARPTDPVSTGRSYGETIANLKGLRELRCSIVDQFVTAIRMRLTSMIVRRFGCAACGLHRGQVAMIYDEVASVLKGHSLTQIYFSDTELFAALTL